MRALAHAGKSWREDLVSFGLERLADAFPAPTAVPGAVNQDEGAHGCRSGIQLSDAGAAGCSGLRAHRLALRRGQAASLVRNAHQEHGLARVLEDIDDALVAV